MSFTDWQNSIVGKKFDGDNDNSFDCVDVPESWCNYLWPDHTWRDEFGYGNAKDHYANANNNYFEKISYTPGAVAEQGDIIVYGATPTNPYGHIAVVISANANGAVVIQENSYTQQAAYIGTLGYSNCIGFLRPKGVNMGEIIDVNTSRVIAHGILARNGLKGRAYALDGSAGDPWVGGELTLQFIQDVFNSPEAKNWRDSQDPASVKDINAKLDQNATLQAQIATLKAQVADLQKQLNAIPPPDPNSVTVTQSGLWAAFKKFLGL